MTINLRTARSTAPALLLLAAFGCEDWSTPPAPAAPQYRSLAEGWVPDGVLEWVGTVEIRTPEWQDRDLAACVGTIGFDGQPARPMYVLFARVPADWKPHTTHEMVGNAWVIRLETDLGSGKAGAPKVIYGGRKGVGSL